MNELLLNCNIGGLFLTMGLPTLDPVMTSVLDYIHQHALFLHCSLGRGEVLPSRWD